MIFVGDIHGKVDWFVEYCDKQQSTEQIVQVGDFGFGFLDSQTNALIDDYFDKNRHVRFIRGNHDSPEVCRNQIGFIEDGTVETYDGYKIMYIGGAQSIDRHFRIEGVSWWQDEELSIKQFENIISKAADEKPNIIVTHDGPREPIINMFPWTKDNMIESRTGQALDAILRLHRPQYWFFGHWHNTKRYTNLGTTFLCAGESQAVRTSNNENNQLTLVTESIRG